MNRYLFRSQKRISVPVPSRGAVNVGRERRTRSAIVESVARSSSRRPCLYVVRTVPRAPANENGLPDIPHCSVFPPPNACVVCAVRVRRAVSVQPHQSSPTFYSYSRLVLRPILSFVRFSTSTSSSSPSRSVSLSLSPTTGRNDDSCRALLGCLVTGRLTDSRPSPRGRSVARDRNTVKTDARGARAFLVRFSVSALPSFSFSK